MPHLITPDCISINISSYIYMSLNSPHDISTISLLLTMYYSYYSFNIPSIPVISPIWVEGGEGWLPCRGWSLSITISVKKKQMLKACKCMLWWWPFLLFWDLKTKNIDFVGREQWPEWHWLSASVGFEVHHLAVLLSGPSSTWNIKLCNNKQCNLFEKLHFCYCISKTNDSAFKIWCIQWSKKS